MCRSSDHGAARAQSADQDLASAQLAPPKPSAGAHAGQYDSAVETALGGAAGRLGDLRLSLVAASSGAQSGSAYHIISCTKPTQVDYVRNKFIREINANEKKCSIINCIMRGSCCHGFIEL